LLPVCYPWSEKEEIPVPLPVVYWLNPDHQIGQ